MFTLRHNLEMFFIITLGTALSLFVLVQRNNRFDQRAFSAFVPTISLPTLTVAASYPIQTSTMDSPDGTKSLMMKKQRVMDQTKYSFSSSSAHDTEQTVFTKELSESQNLSIPYNAWSPDNKYLFLKETTPSINNYYVLNSSGAPLKDDIKYVNIQELFSLKQPDYSITEVTGWADPNLIVVNAKSNKEDRNVSFWFEVSSQSFLQLGTYFN